MDHAKMHMGDEQASSSEKYLCKECNISFDTQQEFEQHIKQHHMH
ncbi:hypothetical protein [Thermoplasma sp. Kam2015]